MPLIYGVRFFEEVKTGREMCLYLLSKSSSILQKYLVGAISVPLPLPFFNLLEERREGNKLVEAF